MDDAYSHVKASRMLSIVIMVVYFLYLCFLAFMWRGIDKMNTFDEDFSRA
jgi:hypothetical protein